MAAADLRVRVDLEGQRLRVPGGGMTGEVTAVATGVGSVPSTPTRKKASPGFEFPRGQPLPPAPVALHGAAR